MWSNITGYKSWWSHGHPKTLGQTNHGILGTHGNHYCTGNSDYCGSCFMLHTHILLLHTHNYQLYGGVLHCLVETFSSGISLFKNWTGFFLMELYKKPSKSSIHPPPYSETAKKGVVYQGVLWFFFIHWCFQPISTFENDSDAALYPQPVKSGVPIWTAPILGG